MKDALLDLIYPPYTNCILCNRSLNIKGKYSICEECYHDISFITENCCEKCSKPFSMAEDIRICGDCSNGKHFFQRALSVAEYHGGIKKLVLSFKYYDATYLSRYIAEMMMEVFQREELTADIIMAVPLHSKRERKRGYNQAHLLGRYISKKLGIVYYKNHLIRIKDTDVLHNLSKKDREKIMQDAFQILNKKSIKDKEILLIDDIFTTGTTANGCSKVLMEAGAKEVTVLTFARGV